MIVSNHDSVIKALLNLKRVVVDECKECGGKEIGCRCRFKMMLYEQAAFSNAPIGLLSKRFADFGVGQEDNEIVRELKERWHKIIYDVKDVVSSGKLIVVSGPNGTGKTMMASITMKSAISEGFTCQYILFSQLVEAFLDKNSDALVNHVTSVDLLVIDEIGKEYKKYNQFGEYDTNSNMAAYSKYVFENVVKIRSDSGFATIIVTNDSVKELEAKYGGVDSSLSSVLHSTRADHLFHTGIDFRGLNA